MRRFCIALSALIPLLCEAAKLTHYADSAFFVKYPMNESTNTPPTNPPRWLEEDCIPGGSHPSNQVKRITLDVACAMAGTTDAFVRRHVSASLFGTPEAKGFFLGTNYFTGAQYATTNIVNSQLWFDHVLKWPEQDTWSGPDIYGHRTLILPADFCLKAIDYNMMSTNVGIGYGSYHVYTNAPTRRLFSDKYLVPIHDMLITNYYRCQYLGNIPGMVEKHGFDGLEDWSHYPPDVMKRDGTTGRIFSSYDVYPPHGPVIGWGSSHAESAYYDGKSNSLWTPDPSDLVYDWGRFYPDIPKIFEPTNVTQSSHPGFRLKDLKKSIVDSEVGYFAFNPFQDVDYDAFARFCGHLDGERYDDETYEWMNEPYPGKHGFELMSDTCGHTVSNFTCVNTRRIVYEPFEHCNAFLGLLDTLYVGQDAMPVWRYLRTKESASYEIECGITSGENDVEIRYNPSTGMWHPSSITISSTNTVTTYTNFVFDSEVTCERALGFEVPNSCLGVNASSTNTTYSIGDPLSESMIIPWAEQHGLIGRVGYFRVASAGTEDWVRFEFTIDGNTFGWEYKNSDPDAVKICGSSKWTASGTKTSSTRNELDYTLMIQTNSWPCCHPIDVVPIPFDSVSDITYTGFAGLYAYTNNVYIEYSTPCANNLFNLTASSGLNTSRAVDYAASDHEERFAVKMNELCRMYCGSDEHTPAVPHLMSSWMAMRPGDVTSIAADKIIRNGLRRSWSCYASKTDSVRIRIRSSGIDVSKDGGPWEDYYSRPEYLRVYWHYAINGDYDTEYLRLKPSVMVKGATTSIEAVHYDFKTMKRED